MEQVSKSIMMSFSERKIQLDPGIWTRTSRIQLLYGAWVNLAQLAIGLAFGFASVQIPQLLRPDSDISITRHDASWIVSVLPLFCPIGCLISGFVMDMSGRRIMLIFSQIPMIIGWAYMSLAKSAKHMIIGRAIVGVGCGMSMGPPRLYCTEISLPNIRGVIGSFPNLAVSLGVTVQAGLGKFFHWHVLCYVCCAFTSAIFISFTFLPETPYFILLTKTEQEARNNLAKFRGPNYDVDSEMEQLLDFKEDNDIRKLSLINNTRAVFTKASCKPFFLMFTYIFIGQAAGNSAIMFWPIEMLTALIFGVNGACRGQELAANSSFDVDTGNILLGLSRMIMGLITAVLIYRTTRRCLALMSAIGVTFVCFAIGAYLLYFHEPSLMPLICFILYICFASLGYYPLPILIAFELYPLQVRGILGGATVSITCILMFASTYMEPLLMDTVGVAYTFVTFGAFSLIGVIFIYFLLPETKDLTLQEIEEYYKEIRPTLTSQRRLMSMSQIAIMGSPGKSKSRLNIKPKRDAPELTRSKSTISKLEAQKKLDTLLKQDKQPNAPGDDEIELGSIKRTKSRVTILDENEDKDSESIKSTKSTDSKKSKRSRKNDEKPPKDEHQPSTSNK